MREYDKVARQCAAEGLDHVRYLLRLAELEMIDREQRLVERRIRAARFPSVKSLDSYDFTALPSLNKALVLELARCEYLARREKVIALGNAGTGKTHLALGLGLWSRHASRSAIRIIRVQAHVRRGELHRGIERPEAGVSERGPLRKRA